MPRLILRPQTPDEQVLELKTGPNTIGRTDDNDVPLAHRSVSRAHARITVAGETATIEDLGSKNGTFVDGARVDRLALREPHQLRCGDVQMRFIPDMAMPRPTMVCEVPNSRTQLAQLLGRPDPSKTALNLASQVADRDRRKLEILLKVSELLSSPAAIDDVLGRIVSLAFEILDIDRGVILLAEGGELEPRVSRSRDGSQADASFSRQIAGYVVEHGKAALFADTQHDPRLNGGSIFAQSICSAMCVPMQPREDLIGVLYVDNQRRADRFGREDLEFLAAFGNQAGIALDNALLTERLAREALRRNNLIRFFPPAAVDTILSGEGTLEPKETQASVMFCDICGYTQLSSGRKARDIIGLLNEYFPVVSDIVFRHEGTLEKFIGDALLAVWGAPFARPDDALRAVSAAVEIQKAVEPLRRKLGLSDPFALHIGIASGTVVAGNIGTDRYLQYATVGDTTNVASRICSVATAGQILVDANTAAQVQAKWRTGALPPVRVKGKDEPLTLHRVAYG